MRVAWPSKLPIEAQFPAERRAADHAAKSHW